jgi:hypothetical protein
VSAEITNPQIPITRLPPARQDKVGKFIELITDGSIPRSANEALRQMVLALNQDQLKLISEWLGKLIKNS